MAAYIQTVLDNVSVPASGTESAEVGVGGSGRIRPVIDASGANITVSAETSVDGGTSWHQLVEYAGAATGAQDPLDLPGTLIRVVADNAGTGAENVTVRLIVERA